ncbi:MAG TPA: hypothetical protein VIG90_14265 [Pedomonas sp.]|uniref:hypothetical protein n=1 Tax=Pedomonas sp. TaxID=2976421 RepID=UPI002F3FA599
MTIAYPSLEPTIDWPEDWSAIAFDGRWTLDRASSTLLDVVTSHPMSLPTSFQFRWRSGRYQIAVQESSDAAVLQLSGVVGTIPFTSEDRSSRRRVLDTLRHMRDIWPCAGLTLAGGQVRLARELPADRESLSFREMVAQASTALLPVQPVIELIESDLWPAA